MQPLFKKKTKNKLSSCPYMKLNISLHFYLYIFKKKKQSVVTYQSCRLQHDFQGGFIINL